MAIQIALGLTIQHILIHFLIPLGFILLLIPFLMNVFDGAGYRANTKTLWRGISYVCSLGTKKRTGVSDENQSAGR